MKILIVSDTHRKDGNLQWVMEKEKPFDMLIHLGDAEGSEYYITHWADPGCELEMVLGNNDFFSNLERERDLMIGKYKTLLTHGHYYHVSLSTEYLKEEARSRDFEIDRKKGQKDLIVLNPGSLSYPRQEGRRPSYMIMEIGEDGEAAFNHYYL